MPLLSHAPQAGGIESAVEPSGDFGASSEQQRSRRCDVGVAIFDNPNEMTSGWAARNGQDPFSFSNPADLANDSLWLLSLNFDEYQRNAARIANFRRSEFLRSGLGAIAGDLGMRIAGRFASESVSPLSRVATQSVSIALQCYGWSSLTDMREDGLADDIRRTLPSVPKPPMHVRAALASAYQGFSKPARELLYEPRSMLVTLRANRLAYAKALMQTMVPDDGWTYVAPRQMAAMPVEDLLNPMQPTLVEAAVELESIDPAISSLIAFGASGTRRTGGLRKWISQPELRWLSRHCRVRIQGGLISKSAKPIPSSMQLPLMLTQDGLLESSLSAGIVAECHWAALASQTYSRPLKGYEVTSWAVWLRAADRAMSFAMALKAQKADFAVTWYGNGAIGVSVTRERLPDLLAFAEANDFASPSFPGLFDELGATMTIGGDAE